MELAEAASLRERLARPTSADDIYAGLRIAGLPLRGPWPVESVVIHGYRVEPDAEPGYLVIDGERRYSGAWLHE